MPTLPKQRLPSLVPPVLPSDLLRRRHRWERWRGSLFTLLAGLGTTLLALYASQMIGSFRGDGKVVAAIWAGGLLVTIVAALVSWRLAPSTLLDTAQQMDRHLTAKNRLEAAATLHGSTSLLAQAQREETAAYLRGKPVDVRPVRVLPWLTGAVLMLALIHVGTLAWWVVPPLVQRSAAPAASRSAATPPKPPAPPSTPKASITWQSPEPESKANPIEEVPTVALAQSTSGLKDMTLEISVNGVPKVTTRLPPTPFNQPGKNLVKSSLYMDELGVQPFDVVTYYIRAQRITELKLPDVASSIQFIQVRPFRDDVAQVRGGEAIIKGQALLVELKLAQLRSIKENFVLVHTDLPVTDPVRVKENDRVGQNQEALSAKTKEVVEEFMQEGVSPDIIDLLNQAAPPMDDAGKKILADQNSQAMAPQQRALSDIVQVEKFFQKVMADKSIAHGKPGPDDPFKDKQQHELKKRMALAAGQLETLARNQSKLSDDLRHPESKDDTNASAAGVPNPAANPPTDSNPSPSNPSPPNGVNPDGTPPEIPLPPTQAVDPFGPDADKGTFAARQARVIQGVEALLGGNKVLPPPVVNALQLAQKDATTSVRELDQADPADAREPAASAAQDLQQAVAEMIKAGDQQTQLAMEASQQKLTDLSQQLRDLAANAGPDGPQKIADFTQQIRDLKRQLEDAADKQQESGSPAGAERLNQLAKAIVDQKVVPDLDGMTKTGVAANQAATDADKLDALASLAAKGAMPGKPSPQDLAGLINSLERSRANLARLAQEAGGSPTPEGQDRGQASGAGQPPGQTHGPGQGHLPSPLPLPGEGPGQPHGAHQASDQSLTRSDVSGQGQGNDPGQGEGHGQVATPSSAAGETGSSPEAAAAAPPIKQAPAALAQAYREVLADLKTEAEVSKVAVPQAHTSDLMQALAGPGHNNDRPSHLTTPFLLSGGFPGIVGPLDQLISELKQALAGAQRTQVVKQPNLDEAPAAYRSAVSDYFEAMSKDYHPDGGDSGTKQP